MHPLLERQLRHAGVVPDEPTSRLLDLVDASYRALDGERRRDALRSQLLSEQIHRLDTAIRSQTELRVRAILDAVGDGVVVVDDGGRVESCNAMAAQLFGLDADQAVGTCFESLWESGYPVPGASGDGMALRPDGTRAHVEAVITEATLEGRRCRIAIVRDVTERRLDVQRLRDAALSAKAASKAKSDFLATMSHEIRTPMNGVLGMVGLLLDGKLDAAQRSYAEAIRDSGEALLSILNDILDFSKIEAGRMTLEEYDFAPAALVESVVELLAPRALAKGIEVAVVTEPGVPDVVRGDAGRLRQVLVNLVGNAVKFTETGGVVVELRTAPGGAAEGGHVLRVDVVDTGIGIDSGVIPDLFGEFIQADASTTRRFGGTGLGLAICRKLCELMGGEVGVESTKGVGSRFWLTLPLGESEGDGLLEEQLAGMRCLVVDDNDLNRRIFERQLGPWGVDVVSVPSGDRALAELVKAVAHERPFDVAVIDQHMPGMSGRELGRVVRAMNLRTHLVLASSGLVDESSDDFDVVFTKPVRPSALLRALSKVRAPYCTVQPPSPGISERPADARRLRVLVVEDNSINQKVAVGYLERAGHRVDVASNGLEALSAVRSLPYDIVLMDVQMPEMDGLEATRAIRALGGENSRVVILGLTANAMREDRDACLAAGMNDHLPKPIERTRLLDKIEAWASAERAPGLVTVAPPDGRVADPTVVVELREALGDEEVVRLLEGFQSGLLTLQGQLSTLPAEDLRARAHQLCGSAGALGFGWLSETAGQVDRRLHRDPADGAARGLLERPLTETLRALVALVVSRAA